MLRDPNSIAKDDRVIEDPVMEPFFITKSKNGGFAVYRRVEKGTNKKKYIENIGYPSNFNSALKVVSMQLLNFSEKTHYKSVKEYISAWNEVKTKMETLTDLE